MASKKTPVKKYTTKKCPACFVYLPLDAVRCDSCNAKVGEPDRNGIAKKPVNWSAYFICLLAWVGLGLYLWKVFF